MMGAKGTYKYMRMYRLSRPVGSAPPAGSKAVALARVASPRTFCRKVFLL